MATARSRISKGRNFQSIIRDKIQECFQLDDDSIRCAIGAETGADVKLTSQEARDKVGMAVECKCVKSLSIWTALDQTKAHAKDTDLIPTLIFRRSISGNRDVWITVPLDHYLDLRKELLELKSAKS